MILNVASNKSVLVKLTIITLALLLSAWLSACSSFVGFGKNKNKDKLAGLTEQKLYETSQKQLRKGQYLDAIEALQKLESDFPFGKFANSAQLSLIYAYFRSDEAPLAESAANRYIRLHPNHPNVDYAHYMLGLINFPKAGSFFQSIFGADLTLKDTKSPRTAFVHFSELVTRFPNSKYAPDALKRMEYLRNLLARHELNVANYYLEREAFLAAANRGRYVLENYQQAPAIPDALAIMVQSYHALGMKELEQDSLDILQLNYPDYPAFNDDGSFDFGYYLEGTRSLSGTLTFGLIDRSRPPGFDTRKQYGKF